MRSLTNGAVNHRPVGPPVAAQLQSASYTCRSCQRPDLASSALVPLLEQRDGRVEQLLPQPSDPTRIALTVSTYATGTTPSRGTRTMRKLMTKVGLGLALTVGTAGAVAAQQTRPDTARPERAERGDRGERGMRRRGGPDAALLKGITLTYAQKTQLKTMREAQGSEMEKNREQFTAAMKEARAAREKGDTATARAKMTALRTQMTQQRERQIAAVRTILTADQQKQFDANVAAWKERGQRGMRGDRDGHQSHGARSGRNR